MSSTPIPEKLYYFSKVFQRDIRQPRPKLENRVLVDCQLLSSVSYYDDTTLITAEQSWSTGATDIPFSNEYIRPEYSELVELMATELLVLGVPQEEQRTIIQKLYDVVQVLRPERRIVVFIAELTIRFLGSFHDLDTLLTVMDPISFTIPSGEVDGCFEIRLSGFDYHGVTDTGVLQESFEAHTVKFVPATRSSIESLKIVRLDSLEQVATKQISVCSICKDEFAEGSGDQLITLLPCAHHFHADCISQWLERSHLCPLCRYALPTVEDHGEPSNS
uniref:uncharacterized protein LOC105351376 n=1 Tax=Fragaria vesca subsp. vesca TaxID=101020 RepID=UPI0005C96163|nr:PREDICTED: uncharacterized protein LOC105351376 [Fragaria vesca subsp. vesca]